MENNPQYNTLFLHGFSVGIFVWTMLLIQIKENPEKCRFLQERLVGQIWDSIMLADGIHNLGHALFANNWLMRKLVEGYVL